MKPARLLALAALAAGAMNGAAACGETQAEPPTPVVADASTDGALAADGRLEKEASAADGSTPTGDASVDAALCNADLATSLQHCGACFHDCSGGACAGGLCTLSGGATALYGALGLGAFGGDLFVASGGDAAGIHSCKKTGCLSLGPTRVNADVDAAGTVPSSVVGYGGYVYWTERYQTGGGAYRTPLDGGPTVRVSKGDSFSSSAGIAVSDAGIAWANDDFDQRVAFCPLGLCAGAAALLPNAVGNLSKGFSRAITFAPDNSIVWTENGHLVRCAAPACPTPHTIVNSTALGALAISGTTVFWAASLLDSILSCPLTGCVGGIPTTVVANQTEGTLSSLAIAGTTLVWTLEGSRADAGPTIDGVVRRCDLTNCAGTVRDVATAQAAPVDVLVDETSIYWVNEGGVGSLAFASTLMKAPR